LPIFSNNTIWAMNPRYLYSKIKAISPQYWLVQLFRPIQASSASSIASG